ncbi:MAG: phenylacetate--CoA ligase, partial [Promethearchaeota archaeon]
MQYNYFDEKREKTPWEELEKNWIKRGRWTLKRLYDNIPFLKKRYQEAGISPDDLKTVEDFQKIPFMTKQDFLDSFPDKLVCVPKEDL